MERKRGDRIVLAGHPYHLDPVVNHGIPELINGYNVAVLMEDSVAEGRAAWIRARIWM